MTKTRGAASAKTKSNIAAKGHTLALRCAAIPANMRAQRSASFARQELEDIASILHGGVLSVDGKKGHVMANLWFARAVHEFATFASATSPEPERQDHLAYATNRLLPICKKIVQQFISEQGMNDVRMDDGAMLTGAAATGRGALRLNALWYAALDSIGQALAGKGPLGSRQPGGAGGGQAGASRGATGGLNGGHGGGHGGENGGGNGSTRDPSADHFERLAGRFRRSFAKAYWCDEHNRICPPEARTEPAHGPLPDAEQILLTMLPSSPLPRTKQREILTQIEATAMGSVGMKMQHSELGQVESLLHRAWLVEGATGATEAERRQALAFIKPLESLWDSARAGTLHEFYRDGQPLGTPDPLVNSEVLGILESLLIPTSSGS